MLSIRYMGSKRNLAKTVADALCSIGTGYCVDLFSGMCSVAATLADKRHVITNDIQTFAALTAQTYIATPEEPPKSNIIDKIRELYLANYQLLNERFGHLIEQEKYWLYQASLDEWEGYAEWCKTVPHTGNNLLLRREVLSLRGKEHVPYRLFSLTFPNSYFGLKQCLEIDSLRFAIDYAVKKDIISIAESRWVLVALMQALSHTSSSPGHFAEFFEVKDKRTFELVRKLRTRNIIQQTMLELDRIIPAGSPNWRSGNLVFNEDSLNMLERLRNIQNIGCVYADPPYTNAQYSRYYHLLETLVRYDYPESNFKGRYRSDRYMAPFCRKTQVLFAFNQLARMVSQLNVPLLLSYPSTGLLYQTGYSPEDVLKKYFANVKIIYDGHNEHSTFGASSGYAKVAVKEYLFLAY